MEFHLKMIGVLLVALGMMHIVFPKYFKWTEELECVSLVNKQIMYVHTFFIALTLVLMGALCLSSANDLITTALGRRITLGFSVFWIARLLIQFFGYSSKLWRGKRLESFIHFIFILLWIYMSAIFSLIFLQLEF